MSRHRPPFCAAISQHGTKVTTYIGGMAVTVTARPGADFICTQDDRGHGGDHTACNGHGLVLAQWARAGAEQYWQPARKAGA